MPDSGISKSRFYYFIWKRACFVARQLVVQYAGRRGGGRATCCQPLRASVYFFYCAARWHHEKKGNTRTKINPARVWPSLRKLCAWPCAPCMRVRACMRGWLGLECVVVCLCFFLIPFVCPLGHKTMLVLFFPLPSLPPPEIQHYVGGSIKKTAGQARVRVSVRGGVLCAVIRFPVALLSC